MQDKIDQVFDVICYIFIAVCFIAAGLFVLKSISNAMIGFYARELIIDAGLLSVIGIIMSGFFFYIKSMSR